MTTAYKLDKFLGWLKKFGQAQNILGPLKDKAEEWSIVEMILTVFPHLLFSYKLPLRQSELPTNPDHVDVSTNVKEFLARWTKAIRDQGVSMVKKSTEDKKFVNIWPVLLKTYGGRLLLTIIFGAVHSLIGFVNPLILDR